jgi:hypothetical protein
MGLIYANTRQGRTARLVLWLATGLALMLLGWAWDLFHTFGLAPGDGGVLRPYPERAAGAAATAAAAALVLAGALTYRRSYVVRMLLGHGQVEVHTVSWLGSRVRRYRLQDFAGAAEFGGGFTLGSYTPRFTRVRLVGHRLPLLLDSRADCIRPAALARVVKGIAPPASAR